MAAVKWATDLQPVSALKARGNELLHQVEETKRPVILSRHGKAVAAIIPIEELEAFEEYSDLLALRKALEEAEVSIAAGKAIPHEQLEAMWADRLREP